MFVCEAANKIMQFHYWMLNDYLYLTLVSDWLATIRHLFKMIQHEVHAQFIALNSPR